MMNALCDLRRHLVNCRAPRIGLKNGCFRERRYYQKTLGAQLKNAISRKKPPVDQQ
jgi:hypothetical protein